MYLKINYLYCTIDLTRNKFYKKKTFTIIKIKQLNKVPEKFTKIIQTAAYNNNKELTNFRKRSRLPG